MVNELGYQIIAISFNHENDGVFFRKCQTWHFPWKKKPFNWENWKSSKMDFQVLLCLCSHSPGPPVLPPWATSNQPEKPSWLRESFLVPGEWRRGEKENRLHGSPKQSIDRVVQCQVHVSEASKLTLQGPGYCISSQLFSSSASRGLVWDVVDPSSHPGLGEHRRFYPA